MQTLLDIFQHDTERVLRRDALDYLAGIGAEAKPLAEPLTQLMLNENDPYIAGDLQRALVDIEANVEPFLLAAVHKASEHQLLCIVETLGKSHASSLESLEFLQQQLSSTNSKLVIAFCRSLERIGPAAHSTLPMLIAIAERPQILLADSNDNDRVFRESRDSTLASIGHYVGFFTNVV